MTNIYKLPATTNLYKVMGYNEETKQYLKSTVKARHLEALSIEWAVRGFKFIAVEKI